MSSVLERLGIPSRVKEALRELVERLEEALGGDFKLYLFGSYARGDWVEGVSDIDVVVVSPRFRGVPVHARVAMVRRLARSDLAFEILCYTPEELQRLLKTSPFIREISRYWIELR